MKTKNIFKTLAFAMLMPMMLLTTACSSEDDLTNNGKIANPAETVANKGYAMPVTVNVSRQGDEGTTRATYNESTKKLSFSTGDKLFVAGTDSKAGDFAGLLEWQSEGTFSGTIMTENEYDGTAEELLSSATDGAEALLIPAEYKSYEYFELDDEITPNAGYYQDKTNAFALTKAAAVEQFSFELAETYSSGFTLSPQNAIVSFTISGLTANKEVAVSFDTYMCGVISKSVTTSAEGVATFAIGLDADIPLENCTLTVDGNNIALPTKTTEAGHIYNISRKSDLLSGVFRVSSTKKVKFSKGNLRYASGAWSFFDNQYDIYKSYSANAWDHFGWSTSANNYGKSTSQTSSTYSGNFVDWGATMGTGWFTLSKAEWTYLFNTRSASTVNGTANGRYAKAKVNNVQGVILFPDTYTHPDGVTAPKGVNATGNTGWNGNNYTAANWTKMESAGCVFLPAAGYRSGTTVNGGGTTRGDYWSSTTKDAQDAYDVHFESGKMQPQNVSNRKYGLSVRLVREVTE